MHYLIELYHHLKDLDWLAGKVMAYGGLYMIACIIFAETGLFIGFFLPGDSLLFLAGTIIRNSAGKESMEAGVLSLLYWMLIFSVAGIIGNWVGFWFGKKSGPLLYERRETWLFKRRHVKQAHDFYEKWGGAAIILARFLPIVRTFAPIIAGVVDMNRKRFMLYNVIGSLLWVIVAMVCGYTLGGIPWVKENFEKIIFGLILVTTVPVLLKLIFGKKKPILDAGKDVMEDSLKK